MSQGQGVGWGLNFVFSNVSGRKMRDSQSIFFSFVVVYPVSEKCKYGVFMYPVSNMVSLCTLFRKKVNMVSLCYDKCNMESLCTLFRKNPGIPKLTKSVWDATQLFSPLTVYIYCGADVRIRRESGSGWLLSLSV